MIELPIAYRPAGARDRDWLWDLKRATMREHVAAIYGWDEEKQRAMFAERFDSSRLRIIQVNGRDAGVLESEERAEEFFLSRIEILPAFQRRGIGSAVIAALLTEAQRRRKVVRLQVLRSNPARRLYERLGFVLERETSTHFQLIKDLNEPRTF